MLFLQAQNSRLNFLVLVALGRQLFTQAVFTVILPGQQVTLRRVMKDEQFRLTGYVNDAIAFDIGGSLRARQS